MGNNKKQSQSDADIPYRRRGRPAGKNRVPLSLEERRARNAHYERERRNETAEAMADLADAVNCDSNISNADLLATVITKLQTATRKTPSHSIEDLVRINSNLESQISMLQSRLGLDDDGVELLDEGNNDTVPVQSHSNYEDGQSFYAENRCSKNQTKKRKRTEHPNSEYFQQEKRAKTQTRKASETSSDSGVELRSHTVSPPQMCSQEDTHYFTPSEEIPVEAEETQYICQAQIDMQSELYNQLFNNDTQNPEDAAIIPNWDFPSTSTQVVPCMETLTRSLVEVPSIISPQEPPDVAIQQPVQTGPPVLHVMEPAADLNTEECDLILDQELTLDFLTDTEKILLNDIIGSELLDMNVLDTVPEEQMRPYPLEDISGY